MALCATSSTMANKNAENRLENLQSRRVMSALDDAQNGGFMEG